MGKFKAWWNRKKFVGSIWVSCPNCHVFGVAALEMEAGSDRREGYVLTCGCCGYVHIWPCRKYPPREFYCESTGPMKEE